MLKNKGHGWPKNERTVERDPPDATKRRIFVLLGSKDNNVTHKLAKA